MQRIQMLMAMLLLAALADHDSFAQFRIADADKDEWTRDDKFAHLFGNYVATDIAQQLLPAKHAVPLILGANILWEIKDGFVPYEKHGFWGGEGFSVKDVVAGAAGVGLNLLVHELIKHKSPEDIARQSQQRSKDIRAHKSLRVIEP
jgi:hypothetical protein